MELLIRIVDKGPGEDCSKRGDILAVKPDGSEWSNEERMSHQWRIVSANLLQTTVDAMLDQGRTFPLGRFRRREWNLDLAAAPDARLFTGARTVETIPLTRVQTVAMVRQKPAMV